LVFRKVVDNRKNDCLPDMRNLRIVLHNYPNTIIMIHNHLLRKRRKPALMIPLLSLTLALAGWGSYANGQAVTFWSEDFNTYADGTQAGTGTPASLGVTWTSLGLVMVKNHQLEATNVGNLNDAWVTSSIPISGYTDVYLTMKIGNGTPGTMENSDFVHVMVTIDNVDIGFQNLNDDISMLTYTHEAYNGSGMVVDIHIKNNDANETYIIDDVVLSGTPKIVCDAPTVNCPAPFRVNVTPALCGAFVNFEATTSGNPTPTLTYSHQPGSLFPIGTTSVTVTASNGCGTDASGSFDITVTDNELPVISASGDISVNNDQGICGAVLTVPKATATDNCGVGDPAGTRSDGLGLTETYPVGITTITWNVSDANGNAAVAVTQKVTVTDNELPIISASGDISVDNDPGVCGAVLTVPQATATDNCGVGDPAGTRSDGLGLTETYPVGITTITWTVADMHGNAAVAVTQKVTVTDKELPIISASGDISEDNNPGVCGAVLTVPQATATDNCGVGDPAGTRSDGLALTDAFPVGSTTITWNVSDVNGNAAVAVIQKVTVADKELPVISTSGDISVNNDQGICGAVITVTQATATDNCGVGDPAGTRSDGLALTDAFPVGSTTITWNVSDVNGNAAVAVTQKVTVTDNELPVISASGDISVNNDQGICGAVLTIPKATATDNCGVGDPAGTRSDGLALTDAFPVGSTTITWNVTDVNGNAAVAVTQKVTVTNLDPVITSSSVTKNVMSVGTETILTVNYSDNNLTTWVINWDDGQTETLPATSQSLVKAHVYSVTGVYSISIKVIDACGKEAYSLFEYVVVFDPSGGFVTGGGWINSPAGAYKPDPTLIGKATFGFVSKYEKGKTIPTGNTEFQFHAGNLNFKSTVYEWLVVSGQKATYRGFGTINGQGSYPFLLSAIDGAPDRFRIKIGTGIGLVYDNLVNTVNTGDDADPTTALGGGSIVVQTKGKSGELGELTENPASIETSLQVYPNPSTGPVTIRFAAARSANATIDIYSSIGQYVSRAWDGYVKGGEFKNVELDNSLSKGLYFIRFCNGSEVKTVRLIVLNNFE
jgi:hypothetical protein